MAKGENKTNVVKEMGQINVIHGIDNEGKF